MRRIRRFFGRGRLDDPLGELVHGRRSASGPWSVLSYAIHALLDITVSPSRDFMPGNPESFADSDIFKSFGREQNNVSPLGQSDFRPLASGKFRQSVSGFVRQYNNRCFPLVRTPFTL